MVIKNLPPDVRDILRSTININNVLHCITELILNSLDANSNAISVRVNLTTLRFQIIDNGEGISESNMDMIGLQYMTSKCNSLEDLQKNAKYYGFRGESLSSIVNISKRVIITSKSRETDNTCSKTIENSKTGKVTLEKDRSSYGTTITVEGFLHNLRVRQTQVKPERDLELIKKVIESLAIINPDVSFSLRNDVSHKILISSIKAKKVVHSFCNLYPCVKISNLHKQKIRKNNTRIAGLISKQLWKDKLQFVYVNKRPVFSYKIQKLISTLFMKHHEYANKKDEYPLYVLNINCPYCMVDFSFEVSKTVVEFQQCSVIEECIEKLICNVIGTTTTQVHQTSVKEIRDFDNEIGVSQLNGAVKSKPVKRKLSSKESEVPVKNNKTEESCESVMVFSIIDNLNNLSQPKSNILQEQIESSVKNNHKGISSEQPKIILKENILLKEGVKNNKKSKKEITSNTDKDFNLFFKKPKTEKTKRKINQKQKRNRQRKKVSLESDMNNFNKLIYQNIERNIQENVLPIIDKPDENCEKQKSKTKQEKSIFDRHSNTQSLVLNTETNGTGTKSDSVSEHYQQIINDQQNGKDFIMNMFLKDTQNYLNGNDELKSIKNTTIQTHKSNIVIKQKNTHQRHNQNTTMTYSVVRTHKTFVQSIIESKEEHGRNKIKGPLFFNLHNISLAESIQHRQLLNHVSQNSVKQKTNKISKCIQTTLVQTELNSNTAMISKRMKTPPSNTIFNPILSTEFDTDITITTKMWRKIKQVRNEILKSDNMYNCCLYKSNINIYNHKSLNQKSNGNKIYPYCNTIIEDHKRKPCFDMQKMENKIFFNEPKPSKQIREKHLDKLQTFESHINNYNYLKNKWEQNKVPKKRKFCLSDINLSPIRKDDVKKQRKLNFDEGFVEENNCHISKFCIIPEWQKSYAKNAKNFICKQTDNSKDETKEFDFSEYFLPKTNRSNNNNFHLQDVDHNNDRDFLFNNPENTNVYQKNLKFSELDTNSFELNDITIIDDQLHFDKKTTNADNQFDQFLVKSMLDKNRNVNVKKPDNFLFKKPHRYESNILQHPQSKFSKETSFIDRNINTNFYICPLEQIESKVRYENKNKLQEDFILASAEQFENINDSKSDYHHMLINSSKVEVKPYIDLVFGKKKRITNDKMEKTLETPRINDFSEIEDAINLITTSTNSNQYNRNEQRNILCDKNNYREYINVTNDTIQSLTKNTNKNKKEFYTVLNSTSRSIVSNLNETVVREHNNPNKNLKNKDSTATGTMSMFKTDNFNSIGNNKTFASQFNKFANTNEHYVGRSSFHISSTDLVNNEQSKSIKNNILNSEKQTNGMQDSAISSCTSPFVPKIITNPNISCFESISNRSNVSEDIWIKKTNNFGSTCYVNKRTGMTSFFAPKSENQFNVIKRLDFIPKGMSPMFIETYRTDKSLSPKSKQQLKKTILESYAEELQLNNCEKCLNSKSVKDFLSQIFKASANKFDNIIPTIRKNNYVSQNFTKEIFAKLTVLGQIDLKYISVIIQEQKLLLLFDQHAVDERVRLEKLYSKYSITEGNKIKFKQKKCNKTVLLAFSKTDISLIDVHKKVFSDMGVTFKLHKSQVEVLTIPICLLNKALKKDAQKNNNSIEALTNALISEITNSLKTTGILTNIPQVIQNIINSEACRGAVKFGDKLDRDSCITLLNSLSQCTLPFQCAHGRPTLTPIIDFGQNYHTTKIQKPNLKNLLKC